MFWKLCAFFWVIPRRLNFICRRLRTLCLFHLHRQVGTKLHYRKVGVFIQQTVWLENCPPSYGLRLFSSQTFSCINTPVFSNPDILHTYVPMKMEQSVPKRRHIKFRRRGITQKKAHNAIGCCWMDRHSGSPTAFLNPPSGGGVLDCEIETTTNQP